MGFLSLARIPIFYTRVRPPAELRARNPKTLEAASAAIMTGTRVGDKAVKGAGAAKAATMQGDTAAATKAAIMQVERGREGRIMHGRRLGEEAGSRETRLGDKAAAAKPTMGRQGRGCLVSQPGLPA